MWKCLKFAFLSFIVLYYKNFYTFQTNSLSLCNTWTSFLLYKKMLDFHLWFCLVQIRGLLLWDLSRVSGAEYFSSDFPTSLVVRNDQESLHQSWSYRDLIIRVWLWREGKQWRVVSRVNKVLQRLFYFSFLKWETSHGCDLEKGR